MLVLIYHYLWSLIAAFSSILLPIVLHGKHWLLLCDSINLLDLLSFKILLFWSVRIYEWLILGRTYWLNIADGWLLWACHVRLLIVVLGFTMGILNWTSFSFIDVLLLNLAAEWRRVVFWELAIVPAVNDTIMEFQRQLSSLGGISYDHSVLFNCGCYLFFERSHSFRIIRGETYTWLSLMSGWLLV